MPYKKIQYTLHCPKCNKDYTVQPQAYFRKMKDEKYGKYCTSCRAKIQWEEMTDEEKKTMKKKSNDATKANYAKLSDTDKQKLIEKRRAGVTNFWNNLTDDQRKEISDKRSKDRMDFISTLSDEDMKSIGEKISETKLLINSQLTPEELYQRKLQKQQERKEYWASLSPIDKERIKSILRNNTEKYIVNMSDGEREKRSKIQTERNREFWDNAKDDVISDRIEKLIANGELYRTNITDEERIQINDKIRSTLDNKSDEEKARIRKLQSESIKKYYDNITDEERIQINDKIRISWQNKSEEDMQIIREKSSINSKAMWDSMTEEERSIRLQPFITWYDQLSDVKKDEFSKKKKEWWKLLTYEQKQAFVDRSKNYWTSLSTESKKMIIRKNIIASNGKNKFHQKVESMFVNSILSQKYYIISETVLSNNNIIHSWDYGIYDKETNTLQMVIDLDGSYYHADNCDYDGLHSKEEYDERRSLSIPDGIKHSIIYEFKIKESFENMMKSLMVDYNQFIDDQFQLYRSIDFPFPKYSNIELIKSYSSLQKMDCDSKYINPSINSRIGDRIITHFHPSIYHAHRYKCLSPYEAWYDDEILRKVIINRILYQSILNPNKILQGFNISKIAPKVSVFSAGRAKVLIHKYLNDCDEIFDPFSGFSGRMLGTVSLGKHYIGQDINELHVTESNNIIKFFHNHNMNINASVDVKNILDSHGEYESLFTCSPYTDKEIWYNSISDVKTCDDWIDECLTRFKCKKYVFVVDHTERYKKYIVEEIKNTSHFRSNSEYIVVIDNKK